MLGWGWGCPFSCVIRFLGKEQLAQESKAKEEQEGLGGECVAGKGLGGPAGEPLVWAAAQPEWGQSGSPLP